MAKTSFLLSLLLVAALAIGSGHTAVESLPRQTAEGKSDPEKQLPQERPAVSSQDKERAFVGSKSCRDCHEHFYELWSNSWHGLAMQPFTAEFAKEHLTPPLADVAIGKRKYRVDIDKGAMMETGPSGDRKYSLTQVMGGKNVYYFLTPMERGRLQVLPLAYEVHKKKWYDMAASGVRHFPDRRGATPDEALDWTDRMFTFNTTCFNCHVTELSTNFDFASDTYRTTWSEPGISCESCHGPGTEHIDVMVEAGDMHKVKDIKLIRAKDFTAEQTNDMCATCHAKMVPLSLAFLPGEKFFDHYDLITWEHADFYPDGRDLGENYTFTSWLSSPCAKLGKLDCNHCHTPSGRPRYEGEKTNLMCMPCHEKLVQNPVEHGHHAVGSKGNECVACHMPMTRFAAMGRTDHSMRPPTPATTVAYQSPNACTMCHSDHDGAWANDVARKWYPNDYQAEVLRRAELIDAARKQQWQRLPEILAELRKQRGDEVFRNSLVRLLRGCADGRKWPVMQELLRDPSTLVRSSAASALGSHLTPETANALLALTSDPSRLVRIRTAMSLAALPPKSLGNERDRGNLEKANREFIEAMRARPDDWASYANLGNFYMERHDFPTAVSCFEKATKLEPRSVGPWVNAAMAYSNLERNDEARKCLRQALSLEPKNAAANFNLGLLLGEEGHLQEAEQRLRIAIEADPQMAAAAYNLSVILGEKNLAEAIQWSRKAHELQPKDPKFAHTLAFYLKKNGSTEASIELLRQAIEHEPSYLNAYYLLGEIYEERGEFPAAEKVYLDATKIDQLPPQVAGQLKAKAREMQTRQSGK